MAIFNLNSNEELKEVLRNDNPPIVPNPAIAERLNYHFLLKSPARKVHSNSFAGFAAWIFSAKSLALKAGLAVVFSSVILFKSQLNNNTSIISADTCLTKTQLVDTNYVFRDTCMN
ncbi:MAG TPA: hypothetical protein VHO72_14445 [Bacteroidales bacterium]|nr:hypothetical protein [Bacteroidales bacterium]